MCKYLYNNLSDPTDPPQQITIIFKNWRECIEQQIYQAELDDVPPAFADGSVSDGERLGRHSLQVSSQDPGRHAEIWAAHIGTTLVVRQSGRSLGLSVRAPLAVVNSFTSEQDLQLCVWGCPTSQRLPAPHLSTRGAARAHCAALLPKQDIYFQACLFDLLVTGDLNASAAAVAALEDARSMISNPEKVHLLLGGADRHRSPISVTLTLAVFMGNMATLLSLRCA